MRVLKSVVWGHLRKVMIQGLIIVVPLAITFWVLRLVFNLMDGFLGPLIEDTIGRDLPGIGIVAILLLVYVAGQLWELSRLSRRMIEGIQKWLLSIPIVGAVYSPARQLIDSFSGTSDTGFKRVVLIEYPKAGTWMIGFLTATTMTKDGEMGVIYVPHGADAQFRLGWRRTDRRRARRRHERPAGHEHGAVGRHSYPR